MSETKEQILKIRDLDITFQTTAGSVHAIRGVNIDLMKGETVAIVGESGSGKSVTMKAAMGILASNAKVTGGTIEFSYHHADGTPQTVDILTKDKKWIRRHINGKRIAMVFQDPMTSLNPVIRVGEQIKESFEVHMPDLSDAEMEKKVDEILEMVGIPASRKREYPHQFSGGMKQRVVIAIAMICNPDLIICDEPTTALDVTIQAQIMELLKELQVKEGKSIVLITHNMGLVAEMADEVCVMYMGRVVEFGKLEDIFDNTCHPYTRALLRSVPVLGMPEGQKLETIPGSTPNPADLKEGCEFADRCSECTEKCRKGTIPNYEVSPGHYVRCVRFDSYPEVKR